MKNFWHNLTCKTYSEGKMQRKTFTKKSLIKTTNIMYLIHTDFYLPIHTSTPRGKKNILTLIDDLSRYSIIHFLNRKYEVVGKLQDYVRLLENKFDRKSKIIRSDRGANMWANQFLIYIRKREYRLDHHDCQDDSDCQNENWNWNMFHQTK